VLCCCSCESWRQNVEIPYSFQVTDLNTTPIVLSQLREPARAVTESFLSAHSSDTQTELETISGELPSLC